MNLDKYCWGHTHLTFFRGLQGQSGAPASAAAHSSWRDLDPGVYIQLASLHNTGGLAMHPPHTHTHTPLSHTDAHTPHTCHHLHREHMSQYYTAVFNYSALHQPLAEVQRDCLVRSYFCSFMYNPVFIISKYDMIDVQTPHTTVTYWL